MTRICSSIGVFGGSLTFNSLWSGTHSEVSLDVESYTVKRTCSCFLVYGSSIMLWGKKTLKGWTFSNFQRLRRNLNLRQTMHSSVFIFSALPLWGFSFIPSAWRCHRLEFKFSKHYSEAALCLGQRKQHRRSDLNLKKGIKQELLWKSRLARENKTSSHLTFLLFDIWPRSDVTQTAVLWLHPLRFKSSSQMISASGSVQLLRNVLRIFHTYAHTDSASLLCQVLHEEWARYSAFYKYQPIDLVR